MRRYRGACRRWRGRLTETFHALGQETTEVTGKVTYTGLRGKRYTTRLRKVLIVTSQSVRYFFVDSAIDEK